MTEGPRGRGVTDRSRHRAIEIREKRRRALSSPCSRVLLQLCDEGVGLLDGDRAEVRHGQGVTAAGQEDHLII
jgi:hypothetical protein